MPRPKLNDYIFYKFVNINGDVNMYFVGSTANLKSRSSYYRRNINNPTNSTYNSKLFTTIREHGGLDEFKLLQIGSAEQITLQQSYTLEDAYRNKLKFEIDSNDLAQHRTNQIQDYIDDTMIMGYDDVA
tara:strand:+ start:23 stop:409 length:387 start_codon:yes stop_codon:yes gene_type:complete